MSEPAMPSLLSTTADDKICYIDNNDAIQLSCTRSHGLATLSQALNATTQCIHTAVHRIQHISWLYSIPSLLWYLVGGPDKRPLGQKATGQKATDKRPPDKRPLGQKATGHKATPVHKYEIFTLYYVSFSVGADYIQDPTADFKVTVSG